LQVAGDLLVIEEECAVCVIRQAPKPANDPRGARLTPNARCLYTSGVESMTPKSAKRFSDDVML